MGGLAPTSGSGKSGVDTAAAAKTRQQATEKAAAADKKLQAAEEKAALTAKRAQEAMGKANALATREKQTPPFTQKDIDKVKPKPNEIASAFEGTNRKAELEKLLGTAAPMMDGQTYTDPSSGEKYQVKKPPYAAPPKPTAGPTPKPQDTFKPSPAARPTPSPSPGPAVPQRYPPSTSKPEAPLTPPSADPTNPTPEMVVRPSKNFNDRPTDKRYGPDSIDAIVLHHTADSSDQSSLETLTGKSEMGTARTRTPRHTVQGPREARALPGQALRSPIGQRRRPQGCLQREARPVAALRLQPHHPRNRQGGVAPPVCAPDAPALQFRNNPITNTTIF